MTDPTGSTSYNYERRGALLHEQKTIGSAAYSTAYRYDIDGNRSSMTYPSGRNVNYTFDFASRPLTAVSGSTNIVSSASYLPFGPATQFVFGNGTTKTMTYDNRYRILENKLTSAAGVIADYNYAEDPAGNITQIHDAVDPAFNRDFGYDDLNRLVTANGGASLWGSGVYQYDAMGNLSSAVLGATRNSSFAYSGSTPKLSSVATNGIPQNVQYDAAGNEIQADGQSFHYSPRNTLADAGLVSYGYDGRGVRAVTSYPASYLSTLQVTPAVLYPNQSATGTVTLAAVAPAGGVVVHLATSSTTLTLPATVTVPAGGTSAVFGISQAASAQTGPVTITASYLFTATANVTVSAGPSIASFSLNPTTVAGGASSTGTVTLTAAAPAGGAPVLLTSDVSAATVPAQIAISAGQTEASFNVGTSAVSTLTTAHITASYNGTASAALSIVNGVASLSVNPSSVIGGAGATGSVVLMAAAPAGGTSVSLVSSTPSVATVPSAVTVLAGATTATFAITSSSVTTSVVATITASLATSSAATMLTVNPCVLTEAAQPTIPTGDTVWFDDTMPSGMTFGIGFDTSQKASGTKSLHIGYGHGSFAQGTGNATQPFQVLPGDRLMFYMLINPCAPPREVEVIWYSNNSGVRGAYWGTALTGDEYGRVSMGPLPTGEGWVRMEVPASLLYGVEGGGLYALGLSRYDGEVWFDRFGRVGTCTVMPEAAQPIIPSGDTVWFDDTMPSGMTFGIGFDTSQKASGTKSLHISYGHESFAQGTGNATQPFQVLPGDRLVFYMLINPCAPPREVEVIWYSNNSGVRGAYWGTALTGDEYGRVSMGPLPTAEGWVRMEVPASLLYGVEGGGLYALGLSRYDGEVWFDRFGRVGTCTVMPEAAQPIIPSGDTVWFDDTMPSGMTFGIGFDPSQKASGTKSLHIGYGHGSFAQGTGNATQPFQVLPGDRLVFYMLINPCAPPREVEVIWYSNNSGVRGAYWGTALTGDEYGRVSMGPLPTAEGWVRMEVPASLLYGVEGGGLYAFGLSRYDGEVWFDRFGRVGTCTVMPEAAQPTIPAGDTVWFDDTMPSGMTFGIGFDTSQKASGTKSLHIGYGHGSFAQGTANATQPFQVLPGDRLVFYMLMNPCAPPREVEVIWYSNNSGVRGAYWGTALTGDEFGRVSMGPLPMAEGWVRMEVPANLLYGVEGSGLYALALSRYDGEVWFDRFGSAPGGQALHHGPSMQQQIGPSGVANSRGRFLSFRNLTLDRIRVERSPISLAVRGDFVARTQAGDDAKRYSLYTPELSLMAETEQTPAATPAIAYEYIWFGGQPVTQFDAATNTPHWTFTDQLGTPILQTNAAGSVDWRVEYEPYGTVYTVRDGAARHQPLRFPGQEYDEAAPSQSYNIFRWYRSGWGRYTQADRIGLDGGQNLFAYAVASPILLADPLGLKCCKPTGITATRVPVQGGLNQTFGIRHQVCADVGDSSACEFKQVITQTRVFWGGTWQSTSQWTEDYSRGLAASFVTRPSKSKICLRDNGVGVAGLRPSDFPFVFYGSVAATVYDPKDTADSLTGSWTVSVTCSSPNNCQFSSVGIP
jgi:RHS repeat-associated protein